MAQAPAQSRSTWTNYPSLLSSLTKDKHRIALEGAALAQQCGRYDDANAIFHDQLPEASTIPILTLQRADGLTMQGCCHERIFLLEAALETVSSKDPTSISVRMLMALMLADAQYWAVGEMDPALKILPRVRAHLRKSGVENLSDVEVSLAIGIAHQKRHADTVCTSFAASRFTIRSSTLLTRAATLSRQAPRPYSRRTSVRNGSAFARFCNLKAIGDSHLSSCSTN